MTPLVPARPAREPVRSGSLRLPENAVTGTSRKSVNVPSRIAVTSLMAVTSHVAVTSPMTVTSHVAVTSPMTVTSHVAVTGPIGRDQPRGRDQPDERGRNQPDRP